MSIWTKKNLNGSLVITEFHAYKTSVAHIVDACSDLNFTNCIALTGYSGLLCEVRLFNYCGSSPCDTDNTLECLDDNVGYTCYCKPGWTGKEGYQKLS